MKPTQHIPKWLLASIFSALAVFAFANQFIYRYAVPPGGDALGHDAIIQTILAGHYDQIYRYHTAWHLLAIGCAYLFHIPTITAMAWLGPLLLVTMAMALYFYGSRYYGGVAGVASALIIIFFSHQPIQTLYDASFPNVLAAGTVLPLTLIALENLAGTKHKKRAGILLVGMLVLLAFSHHITTLYSIPIILLFGIVLSLRALQSKGRSLAGLFSYSIILVLAGFIGLHWFTTARIGGSVHGLLIQFLTADWQWPFFHFIGKLNDPNAIWPLSIYPQAIGEAVVYLGIAGFAVALWISLVRANDYRWRSSLILCLWTTILLIGSQTPALGFPVRLARDLAIPLTLLAGLFIQSMYNFIVARRIPFAFFLLFLGAIAMLGSLTFLDRYKQTISPNPLIHHLAVDSEAAKYINRNLPLTSPVVVFQDDIYLQKFTPIHKVTWIESSETAYKLALGEEISRFVPSPGYLYVEIRRDREESWNNNQGIIEKYLQLPTAQLVATFEQPEKKVYLFKITSAPPASATKESNSADQVAKKRSAR